MIAIRRDEVTRIVGGDRIPELLAQIERLEADKRALEAERQKVVERWRSFEKEAEARGVQLPEALVKQMRADMGVLDDDMRRRIEERFARIERLASERKVEELIGEFTLLRDLMNEFGESGSQQVKEAMEKWRARLGSYGEVQLSVQLQIYISEGNQYLKSLAKAAKAMQHAVALDKFSKLVELRRQMLAEERDVFHRNAEALWKRGRELALEGGALAGEIASARTNDEGVRVLRLEGGEVDCGVSPALQKKLGGEGARLLEPGARVLLFFEGGARDGRLVAVFADNGS